MSGSKLVLILGLVILLLRKAKPMKMILDIDLDELPKAREAVLRAWSSEMGVDFNPDYLDEELTQDKHLGESGLVEAHNILLYAQYAADEGGIDPNMKDLVLDYIGQLLVKIGNALCCKAKGDYEGAYKNLYSASEVFVGAYESAEEEI